MLLFYLVGKSAQIFADINTLAFVPVALPNSTNNLERNN